MSRVVRGRVQPTGLIGPHNSGAVSLEKELPHGTGGVFLCDDGDRRGEFERGDKALIKWAAGWARDACPEWDSDVTKGHARLREIAAALESLWMEAEDDTAE